MKIDQQIVEKISTGLILIIFVSCFGYSLNVFQGVNFMQDVIVMESKTNVNVGNFISFYVFLIGMILCGLILMYPFKNFYAKYGLNKKIFSRNNDKNN
jgi:Na+/proline symporter